MYDVCLRLALVLIKDPNDDIDKLRKMGITDFAVTT